MKDDIYRIYFVSRDRWEGEVSPAPDSGAFTGPWFANVLALCDEFKRGSLVGMFAVDDVTVRIVVKHGNETAFADWLAERPEFTRVCGEPLPV